MAEVDTIPEHHAIVVFEALVDILVTLGENPTEVTEIKFSAPDTLTVTRRNGGAFTTTLHEVYLPVSTRRAIIEETISSKEERR